MARLTPNEILKLSEPVEQVYSNIVDALLINMGKHFNSGHSLSTEQWEIRKLAELGQLNKESIEIIASLTGQNKELITAALENAVYMATKDIEPELKKAVQKGAIQNAAADNVIASQSIVQALNAYEQQKKDPHKYKGRALAEDLETILYLCPKCHAMGKTHSHDNEFSCECGYKMHINEYGFFEGDSLVFDNVLDWDKWQKSYVKDNLALWHSFTEKPITSDEKQILNCIEENETKELFSDNCTISIYDDRLEFVDESKGKKVFMLSDIVKMSMGGETKLYFTTSNGFYYEVGSHTRRSSVKYFALYRVLTGREYL